MRKIMIGLSGLLILGSVVVLFVNAQNSQKEVKKSSTELPMDCVKCPAASSASSSCGVMKENKKAACDPAKCKEEKCDPATCKAHAVAEKTEVKECEPAMCGGCSKK
jgi:hypothetical protein